MKGATLGKVDLLDRYAETYLNLGAHMAQSLSEDIQHAKRESRRLTRKVGRKIFDVRNWADAYREAIQWPEEAPRVADMRMIAKEIGYDPKDGPMTMDQALILTMSAKRATTDFTAAGLIAKRANRVIPFFIAAFQGPRATYDTSTKKGFGSRNVIRGIQMAAFTLALWWVNKDEDWHKELSPRERAQAWFVPLGDGPDAPVIRVPRVFEIGALFAAAPESMAHAWHEASPETAEEYFGAVFDGGVEAADNAVETLKPELFPVPLSWYVERERNRTFFWDRPIVSRANERKPSDEQFTPYTSTIAIKLGELTEWSPQKIDHFAASFFGGVGTDAMRVFGRGEEGESIAGDELADLPVVGRQFKRGGKSSPFPESVNPLYDLRNQAKVRAASTKHEETDQEERTRKVLDDAASAVSALRSAQDSVETVKEERALRAETVRIAQQVLKLVDSERITVRHVRRMDGLRKRLQRQEKRSSGSAKR